MPCQAILSIILIKISKFWIFRFFGKTSEFWITFRKRAVNAKNSPQIPQKSFQYTKKIQNYWFSSVLVKKKFPYYKCEILLCRTFLKIFLFNLDIPINCSEKNFSSYIWSLALELTKYNKTVDNEFRNIIGAPSNNYSKDPAKQSAWTKY